MKFGRASLGTSLRLRPPLDWRDSCTTWWSTSMTSLSFSIVFSLSPFSVLIDAGKDFVVRMNVLTFLENVFPWKLWLEEFYISVIMVHCMMHFNSLKSGHSFWYIFSLDIFAPSILSRVLLERSTAPLLHRKDGSVKLCEALRSSETRRSV